MAPTLQFKGALDGRSAEAEHAVPHGSDNEVHAREAASQYLVIRRVGERPRLAAAHSARVTRERKSLRR